MGTTVVACLFHDESKVSIAHVGDSRAYRLRDNRFEQMTLDHSAASGGWSTAVSTPNRKRSEATNKNYVTRALGVEQNVEVRNPRAAGTEKK